MMMKKKKKSERSSSPASSVNDSDSSKTTSAKTTTTASEPPHVKKTTEKPRGMPSKGTPRLGHPVPPIYLTTEARKHSTTCDTEDDSSWNSNCPGNVPNAIRDLRSDLQSRIDLMGSDILPPGGGGVEEPCRRPARDPCSGSDGNYRNALENKNSRRSYCPSYVPPLNGSPHNNAVLPPVHVKLPDGSSAEEYRGSRTPPSCACCGNKCACHVPTTDTAPLVPGPVHTCACSCEPGPNSPCISKRGIPQAPSKSLVDIPLETPDKPCDCTDKSMCNNPRCHKKVVPPKDGSLKEMVEVYYFDHGSSGYYRTTDNPQPLATADAAERTDTYATRFWAEFFGVLHIGCAFVTTFILQLFRFVCASLLRPLIVGVIQLMSDYFFKPLLSILFNGVIQPILILLYNTATSFRDLCEPLAQTCGFFLRELAVLFHAIRLVEVNVRSPECSCKAQPCKCAKQTV